MTTIADVARRLQISPSTVSRALADHPHINEQTKLRVRACVRDMDYHPNRLARGLRAGRTRTLGLVALDVGDPFYTEIAHGAEDAALDHGYMLMLCNADNSARREAAYVNLLGEHQVDGMLITPADRRVQRAAAARVPHIMLIDADSSDPSISSISVDHEQGARVAMEHLLSLGHRRIAFVNWTLEAPHCASAQRGVEATLADHGIARDAALLRVVERPDSARGAAVLEQLLQLPDPPTAVFAYGDLMAYGVMSAAQAAGLVVPRDLSVVGYDDIPLAQHLRPALTTVRQDTYAIGRRAAEVLIEEIEGSALRQRILVQAHMSVRASTAPYKAAPKRRLPRTPRAAAS